MKSQMHPNISFYFINILVLTGIIGGIYSCKFKNETKRSSRLEQLDIAADTCILQSHKFEGFLFQFNRIRNEYYEESYYCSVKLKGSIKETFLFESLWLFEDTIPHIIDAPYYYAFPYSTLGNCHRCNGLEIFKFDATEAGPIYIGRVTGHEDIDGDGEKELYVFVLSEPGKCHADDVLSKVEVYLDNDSLIYPFPKWEY